MTTDGKVTPRDMAEDYWCFVQNTLIALDGMPARFSFYGLDKERLRLHTQMAEALGLTESETKDITDHMDECKDFDDFYQKLLDMAARKKETANAETN